MRALRHKWILVFFLLPAIGRTSPADGEWAEGAALAVGHGWAVVRETRTLRFTEGEQDILLEGIPAEADLSSLVLRARRVALALLEWGREGEEIRHRSSDPGVMRDDANDAVVWIPARARQGTTDAAPADAAVSCRVRCASAGQRAVQILYVVRGFDWKAHYEVTVRGEREEELQPVSVDLFGVARIRNPAARSFDEVSVILIQDENGSADDARVAPGFLVLDEASALADLWNRGPEPSTTPFAYALPGPVRLAPRGETQALLAQGVRMPAEHLYVLRAEHFPLAAGPARPLRKLIVFPNEPSRGLGRALPPGNVTVFIGSQRRILLQEGVLPRTPPGAELRMDLGYAELVSGMRRSLGRSRAVEGFYEEAIEVTVRNGRASPIRVELDEKPPSQLKWNVVRSNEEYDLVRRRLLFRPLVEAGSDRQVLYRLMIEQPGI